MSEQNKNKWYVLYTKNKKEKTVANELGLETIVPMFETTKKVRGINITTMVPRYLNYVFVQHDGSNDFFQKCINHPDVIRFANSDYFNPTDIEPQAISDEEYAIINDNQLNRNISVGDKVEIIDGAYGTMRGSVIEDLGKKCVIQITLFGSLNVKEIIPKEFLRS